MSSLAGRREAALSEKLQGLGAEFKSWMKKSEANQEFEKNHTQIRALTGHLCGLRAQIQQEFTNAKASGILAEARNLESLVLGVRRIWEFFRSKLAQRRDENFRPFLQLADELAWSCYKPVLDIAGGRREPPLVFLNGGLSPYALSRADAFTAEEVAGEALVGRAFDEVLEKLPIPVIGVPWAQASHLPDLPVVAHETGHDVESDFGLADSVKAAISAKVTDAKRAALWKAWSHEVFADLWGCLTLGPAFVGSLMDFLAVERSTVENEISSETDSYPTAYLRILLCLHALDALGFTQPAAELEKTWTGQYPKQAMAAFTSDLPAVFDAVLKEPHRLGTRLHVLRDIPDLRFKTEEWGYAEKIVEELKTANTLNSADKVRLLVAAARFRFEEDPAAYRNEPFRDRIGQIVRPGTRAGETELTEQQKHELSQKSVEAGKAWFDDFAKWAAKSPRR